MKSKTPFVWTLIGVIFGVLGSLSGIMKYFVVQSTDQGFSDIFNAFGVNIEKLMMIQLIMSIVGLLLSLALIYYVIKLAKNPTRKDYIVTTVLGGLGMFIGMGFGGILVLIGGIIGILNTNKP